MVRFSGKQVAWTTETGVALELMLESLTPTPLGKLRLRAVDSTAVLGSYLGFLMGL